MNGCNGSSAATAYRLFETYISVQNMIAIFIVELGMGRPSIGIRFILSRATNMGRSIRPTLSMLVSK